MIQQGVVLTPVNFTELQQALVLVPKQSASYVKTALFRFARRVAKTVKKESLHGRPGIKGGPWARISDKNMQGLAKGDTLSDLRAIDKVSRVLRVHVEGGTITAKRGGALFLRAKGRGAIIGVVKSVTIPARVKVIEPWEAAVPQARVEVLDALHRAMQQSINAKLKAVGLHG